MTEQDLIKREIKELRRDECISGMRSWDRISTDARHLFQNTWAPVRRRGRAKKSYKEICDDIVTLDIEVTSYFKDENDDVHIYEKESESGHDEKFYNSCEPEAVVYIWQCSINDTVYYGRSLGTFRDFLRNFPEGKKIIIWVHNLSYEFRFLSNLFRWEQVFCRDSTSVMKCVAEDFSNIEFRCTLMLTTLSLQAWGDSLGLPKLVGDLDYNKMRTPWTNLTREEYAYCKRDCEVVYTGLLKYREQYGHLEDIPLTGTGEVRRVFKNIVKSNKGLQTFYQSLTPSTEEYCYLKECFAGGYTHANAMFANRNLRNLDGYHYDFTSSYPYVMVSEKFPSTRFRRCDVGEVRDDENWAYIMRVRFKKVEEKCSMHYISASKTITTDTTIGMSKSGKVVGLTLDNGRVVSNKDGFGYAEFDMVLTELDLNIIEKSYDVEYEIVEMWKSHKAYLPREFTLQILKLYENKTRYKSVAGMEEIYNQSKRLLNGVYGCFVMKPVDTDVVFDNDTFEFTKDELDYFTIYEKLEELKSYKRYGIWNSYAQGVWITAYARYNLWECILENPDNVMYTDTDSIFTYKKYDFSAYNTKVMGKLREMCKVQNIDFSMCCPRTPSGVEKLIGLFDLEDTFTEFKTLGAKRYVYRPTDSGKLVLTVAGINKGSVAVLEDNIDNFKADMIFHRDHASVRKQLIHHFTNASETLLNEGKYDEYYSTLKTGTNMRPTGYSMGMDDYLEHLDTVESFLDDYDISLDKSFDNLFMS